MNDPIRVFIVDDSAVVRQVVAAVLAMAPDIEVAGVAADPLFAEQKMAADWPDVIILDIEMPRMDGLTFLERIMETRPTPVVICSTLTTKGAQTTLQALSAGAVEIVSKPKVGLKQFLAASSADLIRAVRNAARARVHATHEVVRNVQCRGPATLTAATHNVVALGTSTGGTQALEVVLGELPVDCPGIVAVQHMPPKFTAAFAERLNRLCRCEIKEAEDGDRVRPGRALIAPGGRHMQLRRSGAQYWVTVADGPPVNRHKPSVDVLFRSVSRSAGSNAIGVLMTGMGDDGARGLLEMRQTGALTAAQDAESCVVFGMPKEAIKLGAAMHTLPLADIGSFVLFGTSAVKSADGDIA